EHRGVAAAQSLIERPRVVAKWCAEPLGEVDLEDVACTDVFDGALDGVQVGRARHVGDQSPTAYWPDGVGGGRLMSTFGGPLRQPGGAISHRPLIGLTRQIACSGPPGVLGEV